MGNMLESEVMEDIDTLNGRQSHTERFRGKRRNDNIREVLI